MFSLVCVWINGWVNNGEAGDFRRHRAHYDVTVMVGNVRVDIAQVGIFPKACSNAILMTILVS